MNVDEWIRLASNVGVPAILAGYIIIRLDSAVRAMEISLRGLADRVDELLRRMPH